MLREGSGDRHQTAVNGVREKGGRDEPPVHLPCSSSAYEHTPHSPNWSGIVDNRVHTCAREVLCVCVRER